MLTWSKFETLYATQDVGALGRWSKIFEIEYDACAGSKHPDGSLVLKCRLPGVKVDLGHFRFIEDAKVLAQSVCDQWILGAGLQWAPASVNSDVKDEFPEVQ